MDLTSALEASGSGRDELLTRILQQDGKRGNWNRTGTNTAATYCTDGIESEINSIHLSAEPSHAATAISNSDSSTGRTATQSLAASRSSTKSEQMKLLDSMTVDYAPKVYGNTIVSTPYGTTIVRAIGNVLQVGQVDHEAEQFVEKTKFPLSEQDAVRDLRLTSIPAQYFDEKWREIFQQCTNSEEQQKPSAAFLLLSVTQDNVYVFLLDEKMSTIPNLRLLVSLSGEEISNQEYNSEERIHIANIRHNDLEDKLEVTKIRRVSCLWMNEKYFLAIQQGTCIQILSIDIRRPVVNYAKRLWAESARIQDFQLLHQGKVFRLAICSLRTVTLISWNICIVESALRLSGASVHRCLLSDHNRTTDETVGSVSAVEYVQLHGSQYLVVVTEASLQLAQEKQSLRLTGESLNMAINEQRRSYRKNKAARTEDGNGSHSIQPENGTSSPLSQLFNLEDTKNKEIERYRQQGAHMIFVKLPFGATANSHLTAEVCYRLPIEIRNPTFIRVQSSEFTISDSKTITWATLGVETGKPIVGDFQTMRLPTHHSLLGIELIAALPSQLFIQTHKSSRSALFGFNMSNPNEDDPSVKIALWSLIGSTDNGISPQEESKHTSDTDNHEVTENRTVSVPSRDRQLKLIKALSKAASSRALAAEALCVSDNATSEELKVALRTAHKAVQESHSAWEQATRLHQPS